MKWSRRRLMPGENERMAQQYQRAVESLHAVPGPNPAWYALALIGVVASAAWGVTGGILALFSASEATIESASLAAAVMVGGGAAIWLTRLKISAERENGTRARTLAAAEEIDTVSLHVRRAWHISVAPDWMWLLLESDDGRFVLCTGDLLPQNQIAEPRRALTVEFFPPDDVSVANFAWSGEALEAAVGDIEPADEDLPEPEKEFVVYEFDQLPKDWQRQIRAA